MMSRARAFTLIELLVVIGVVSLLVGILVPSLAAARESARSVKCSSNLRQMGIAWAAYAGDHRDRVMPLAYWSAGDIGTGPQVFWWGTHGSPTSAPDFSRGFLSPYMSAGLHEGSVFECPSQAWGTYRPQGPSRSITSTYGYNGYYLSPGKTPGWGDGIGHRPWQRLASIEMPSTLLVFADTLLPSAGAALPGNTALLDPPLLFDAGSWRVNPSPTSAFRHERRGPGSLGACVGVFADGHVARSRASAEWLVSVSQGVGSISGVDGMSPGYVPDWQLWRASAPR